MQFKVITAISLALATTSQAVFTPDGFINVLESLTNTAWHMRPFGGTLTPLLISSSVVTLINDVANLGAVFIEAETGLNGLRQSDLNPEEQTRVCSAAENFVDKARVAIDTVVGPKTMLGNTAFVGIAAQVLSKAVDSMETFSRGLIKVVPSCEKRLNATVTEFTKAAEAGLTRFDHLPELLNH